VTRGVSRAWLAAVAVALLAAAGIVAAVLATHGSASKTIVTITSPDRTVRRTVTEQSATTAPSTTAQSGTDLNNAGYAKMQAGDFAGALPLLEQAVQKLGGTGSLDEAYADYNLAYTRFQLGRCTDVLTLLDASQRIQGHRKEIDQLRHDARKPCGGGGDQGNGD
jgi:tetratricopeptide (TPR) repeat protein